MVVIARCGCSSDRCGCNFVAGNGVAISGAGSPSNPYVVSAEGGDNGGGGVQRLVGEIVAYGGSTAPAGWLICNGAAVSRTLYADLFAVIGVDFGAGDGSTTFNLPAAQGRTLQGPTNAAPRGTTGGSATATLDSTNVPSHTHPLSTAGNHRHDLDLSTAVGDTGANVPTGTVVRDRGSNAAVEPAGDHTHVVGANTGGGQPFSIVSPFVSVNMLIKT